MRLLALGLFALLAMLGVSALTAVPADAKQTHVLLEEEFGSAVKQSFEYAQSAVVDQSSGDVLVIDAEADKILRFHSDGTPSEFSALSTNAIDGKGPGADETPQNGIGFSNPVVVQIAVDNSGTATDGDIYVTQNLEGASVQAVDIFAESGEYLGQLTGAGLTPFSAGGASSPCGVAADPKGNLYVGGDKSNAIYKFDPTLNPPVNADNTATFESPRPSRPCSIAAGAGPSAGSLFAVELFGNDVFKLDSSSGATEYVVDHSKAENENPQHVSVNPSNGHVFVTTGPSSPRVAEYDASQSSGPVSIAGFKEGSNGVAIDSSIEGGRLYLVRPGFLKVYSGLVPLPEPETTPASNIEKTSATLNGFVETNGEELTECSFEYVDEADYDYEPEAANPYAAGETVPCVESFAEIGVGDAEVHADVSSLGLETVYHYRLVAANENGAADPQGQDIEFQTKSKPELLAEWAEGVTLHEATLKAQINPQSADTTYHFEWGLTEAPYEHSSAAVAIGSEPSAHTVSLFLQGLTAGATYHFRVVAVNEIGTSKGADHAFTTFKAVPPPAAGSCGANEAFRGGPAAFLPDCRAYEMVSPVDKNGGDIVSTLATGADPGAYVQAAPDGNRIAYSALFASFCGEPNGFRYNQYLAERTERGQAGEGWSCEGIHPPVRGHRPEGETSVFGFNRDFIAFTPDLCNAWLVDIQTPPPTAEGQVGYRNLYRRDNCGAGAGGLEALTSSPPALPAGTEPEYVSRYSVQGVSDDGRHALFVAYAPLAPGAHAETKLVATQIYDRFGGANHLVSVLPGGAADTARAEVGGGANHNQGNAVADDGARAYWTSGGGRGTIYLREHPEQGKVSGECDEAGAKACTVTVSANLSTPEADALFWTATPNGSKALYSEGPGGDEDLYEFELAGKASHLVAEHIMGVAGTAEDLSRIYFVSEEALTGKGAGEGNSEGDFAVAGEPNLYLEEGGTVSFVATLVGGDVGENELGAGASRAYNLVGFPYERATRVTPDGSRIAFDSRAPLTGYDNTESASGKAAVEVFSYEAGGALSCVSCNPSGGRPGGVEELRLPYKAGYEEAGGDKTFVRAAAWIPTWEHPLHASNVLSADGNRLFFNSFDALVPRDTNGVQDVYEWEAPGSGGCHSSDADFVAKNGGCLYLVSTGESPSESEFWEASPDGRDVFFTTTSSLLPQDPGSIDLYDARVGGGFPQPEARAECEGEACQSPPPPPAFNTPSSSSYNAPGNPKKHACPKGKHRVRRHGKTRCVKNGRHNKHASQHKRRANHNRGAAR